MTHGIEMVFDGDKDKMLNSKSSDNKLGIVEGLLLAGVMILACLIFFVWFMFLPFEISMLYLI